LPPPAFPEVTHAGWLHYLPQRTSCPGDGYLIASCDGATGPFTIITDLDPVFIGRWVQVDGRLIEGTTCPQLIATRVRLAQAPCAAQGGAVTGVLTAGGQPLAGATVTLGEASTVTGASGRYFLTDVPTGRHALASSAPCSLAGELGEVVVNHGVTTVVPRGTVLRADVQEDCAVDLFDLVRATLAYHTAPPFHPGCADLDGNGAVDLADVAAVSAAYGIECPTTWSLADATETSTGRLPRGPDGSAPAAAGSVLVYRGVANPIAWDVHVAVRGRQSDPRLMSPRGSWTISNSIDPDGMLHVAAAALGAEFALEAGDIAAWLPGAEPHEVTVVDATFAGAHGTAASGTLHVAPWGGCPATDYRCRTAWIPAARIFR
jgi:hypothetical protein